MNLTLKKSKETKLRIIFGLAGFFVLLCFFGCDTENANDCFQRTGKIVVKEVKVTDFKRILVNPNVELSIKKGETTKVIIETGDNLLEEVSAVVEGDRLILSNTNDCNFVRSYNQTKIYVTAPDITEIRSATQYDISSDGVLDYPSLRLLSENFNEDTGTTTGNFILQVQAENISIVANNIGSFFLKGKTSNLDAFFASGLSRLEAADLIAEDISVFHRGENQMIVNPRQSLKGEIRSTGNVIAVNEPPIVEVEEFFLGKLIFE